MSRTVKATALLLALHWAAAGLAWSHLPAEIPVEEDAAPLFGVTPEAGEDGQLVVPLGPWTWFGFPGMATLLAGAVWGLARLLRNRPLFLGLRGRRELRRLPEDARARVLGVIREGIELFALPIVFVFALVQAGAYGVAVGERFLPWTLGGLLASALAFSYLLIRAGTRAREAVDREIRDLGTSED